MATPNAVQSALDRSLQSARERGWNFRMGDSFTPQQPPGQPSQPGQGGDEAFQKAWDQFRWTYNSPQFENFRNTYGGGQQIGSEWAQWPTVENKLPDPWKAVMSKWRSTYRPDDPYGYLD